MIFTIFTVIFLPLSFFTSLFGMNTSDWGGDASSPYPSLHFIGQVSLPASVAVIVATLVAAFSARVQVAVQSAWRRARRGAAWVQAGVRSLEPAASRRAKERRRAEKEEAVERERRRKERGYDFWATVRRQRTLGAYEIPEANRVLVRAGTGFESAASGGGGKGLGLVWRGGK